MNEDEIVDDMISTMASDVKFALEQTPEEDLIMFHHGPGTRIRNHYRLWDDKNPFTDNTDPMGDKFADQVSQRIIVKLWEKLREHTANQA